VTRHVVQFSGGIGSWAATQRVIAEHGTADLVLLFADTKVEDDDLYRFLDDAAAQIGVPVTVVADWPHPVSGLRRHPVPRSLTQTTPVGTWSLHHS